MSATTAFPLAGPITEMTVTFERPSGHDDGDVAAAEDVPQGGLDAR